MYDVNTYTSIKGLKNKSLLSLFRVISIDVIQFIKIFVK